MKVFENEDLDRCISKQEVIVAVKNMKVGKAPGLDGIGADIYKKLLKSDDIVDLFTSYFNKIYEKGLVPQAWA